MVVKDNVQRDWKTLGGDHAQVRQRQVNDKHVGLYVGRMINGKFFAKSI